ncbi:MAG: heme-binding domain-containing protein [Solirubrobacteraceae bacterium]
MSLLRRSRARFGIFGTIVLGALVLFVLAQAVPYGRSHANPKPTRSVRFSSAQAEKLFATACGDCHSDTTRWPWYSNVAPMSWLVQNDVDGGRGRFNVSEWDRPQPDAGEISEVISSGEMPPWQYTLIHGDAKLSSSEKRDLVAELGRIYQQDPPGGGATR